MITTEVRRGTFQDYHKVCTYCKTKSLFHKWAFSLISELWNIHIINNRNRLGKSCDWKLNRIKHICICPWTHRKRVYKLRSLRKSTQNHEHRKQTQNKKSGRNCYNNKNDLDKGYSYLHGPIVSLSTHLLFPSVRFVVYLLLLLNLNFSSSFIPSFSSAHTFSYQCPLKYSCSSPTRSFQDFFEWLQLI